MTVVSVAVVRFTTYGFSPPPALFNRKQNAPAAAAARPRRALRQTDAGPWQQSSD